MRPRWLRTRDDPAELHRAVLVMTRAGYPHIEAQREFIRYRGQVREAIATAPAVALAGLLSGVSIALAVVVVFAVGALVLAAVQTAASGGGPSASDSSSSSVSAPRFASGAMIASAARNAPARTGHDVGRRT